jgi:hypothetical protein
MLKMEPWRTVDAHNCGAVAQNGGVEAQNGGVDAQNGGLEPSRDCRPPVADLHHLDEEQDPDPL